MVSILIWLDVGFGVLYHLKKILPLCSFNPYLTGCGFRSSHSPLWCLHIPVSILIWLDVGFGDHWVKPALLFKIVSILIWLDVGFGVGSPASTFWEGSSFNPYLTGCGFRRRVYQYLQWLFVQFQSLFDWMWVSESNGFFPNFPSFWFQSLFDWMWVSEIQLVSCLAIIYHVSILIWLDVGFGGRMQPRVLVK